MTMMVMCQPLTAPTGVLDPNLTHTCMVCGRTANEETSTFDMTYCEFLGDWVDLTCHLRTCRAYECDPANN